MINGERLEEYDWNNEKQPGVTTLSAVEQANQALRADFISTSQYV